MKSRPGVIIQESGAEKPQYSRYSLHSGREKPAGMPVQEVEHVVAKFKKAFNDRIGMQFTVARDKGDAFGASGDDTNDIIKGGDYGQSGRAVLADPDLHNTYAVLGNLRRKHGGKFLRTGLSFCDELWLMCG